MPPVSKQQAKFFRGVESGSIKAPGLSPEKAGEMVSGYSTKDLPQRATKKSTLMADTPNRRRQMRKVKKKRG